MTYAPAVSVGALLSINVRCILCGDDRASHVVADCHPETGRPMGRCLYRMYPDSPPCHCTASPEASEYF